MWIFVALKKSKVGRSTVSDKGLSINLADYGPSLVFRSSINSRTDCPTIKELAAASFPTPAPVGGYLIKQLGE
jgi:hypothetical protein